jgi:addiction module RelB/DinJ family antitoxin
MDSVINIRTEKKLHSDAKKVFKNMGLTTSGAINLFLRHVVKEQELPFTPGVYGKKLLEENNSILKAVVEQIPVKKSPKKKSIFGNFWK